MTAGPMRTADEIFGQRLALAPWLAVGPSVELVVAILPTVEDDLAADVVEHLGLELVDRVEEVRALRAVLSAALALARALDVENLRLKTRVADLLDAGRRNRVAA